MINGKLSKEFANAFSAAPADNALTAQTLGTLKELHDGGLFTEIGKVFATSPNNYKGVMLTRADGKRACVLFGQKSADKVEVGDDAQPDWTLVQVTYEDGRESRFRLSIGGADATDTSNW